MTLQLRHHKFCDSIAKCNLVMSSYMHTHVCAKPVAAVYNGHTYPNKLGYLHVHQAGNPPGDETIVPGRRAVHPS